MQVILLSYPGVQGEVAIAGFSNLVACQSLSMTTSENNSVETPGSFGDVGASGQGGGPPNGGRPGFGVQNRTVSSDYTDHSPTIPSQGGSSQASARRVGIDNLSITKGVDQATPKLLEKAFTKKSGSDNATIIVLRAFPQSASDLQSATSDLGSAISSLASSLGLGATSPTYWHTPFLTISLTDVAISSYEVNVSGSDMTETIKISFKKINVQYTVFKNGVKGGTVVGNVDLTQASSSDSGGGDDDDDV